MYNIKSMAGLRRAVRIGTVLSICLSPAAVLAEANVSDGSISPNHLIPNVSVEEDVVILQDEGVQTQIIAAAFTPSGSGLKHETRADQGGTRLQHVTEHKESRQLPYSLVLALIALVGLVPVSRRNHH